MYKNSIFNDVLGPVMTGPSSSHTAGPWRIGYTVGHLINNIESFTVKFPKNSSYAGVYKGQKSDVAMVAGILGISIDSELFKEAFSIAKERNISITFEIIDTLEDHPNTAILVLKNKEKIITVKTLSTGGGTIHITEIQEEEVDLKGNTHNLIVYIQDEKNKVCKLVEDYLEKNSIEYQLIRNNDKFILLKLRNKLADDLLNSLNALLKNESAEGYFIPAVLPITDFTPVEMEFTTAKETLEYCRKHNISFEEAAILYEIARSGKSREEIYEYADYLLTIMENSIKLALSSDLKTSGFLKPSARKMYELLQSGKMIDTGVIQKASIYATGIMEVNSAMGVVVASPTAGSCGILGAVLVSLYETGEYTRKQILEAMMCAGLVGIFICEQATFAAEVGGCQAEMGSSSSMAAAAIAFLIGCDIEQIMNSSSTALQNMLGLVCDPVGGCVDIPCVNRNSSGVANAIVSANMVYGGFDPVIPLDDTIQAMFNVGNMLPRELRCTGLGGLCDTCKGREIAELMKNKNN